MSLRSMVCRSAGVSSRGAGVQPVRMKTNSAMICDLRLAICDWKKRSIALVLAPITSRTPNAPVIRNLLPSRPLPQSQIANRKSQIKLDLHRPDQLLHVVHAGLEHLAFG